MTTRTFEDLLKEANAKGLSLANLFQLRTLGGCTTQPSRMTGEWQANFHHATGWYDYGRGDSPMEALEDGLARAKGAKGPENRPLKAYASPKEEAAAINIDDII